MAVPAGASNASIADGSQLRLIGDESITNFANDTDSGAVVYDGTGTISTPEGLPD